MRLHLVDPGLLTNTGHHANFSRYIVEEARTRGLQTRVLSHRDVEIALQHELGAIPWFRSYTYNTDPDPICGWLSGFLLAKNLTRADLEGLTYVAPEDIVYIQGAQPAQLVAAIEWASGIPSADCPLVVVELGGDAGLILKSAPDGEIEVDIPNPNIDARATLFRFAGRCMRTLQERPFHVVTYDPVVSATYNRLMERDVGVLPFLTPGIAQIRSRSGKRPITISALGHQQPMKGYHLMPQVAAAVLKSKEDIRLLVHNSDPAFKLSMNCEEMMRDAQVQLRRLSNKDSRLVVDDRAVDFKLWEGLIDATDLMLCPYDPRRYAGAHSGIAAVAIANAIPMVVPSGTTLSHWQMEFGGLGTTFDKHDAASVADAVIRAVRDFDTYADRAAVAAVRWFDTVGPNKWLDALLSMNNERMGGASTHVHWSLNAVADTAGAQAHKKRGDEFLQRGDLDSARLSYEKALAANGDFGEVFANLALVLKANGDLEMAESHLRRAAELLPDRPGVLSNLGLLLHERGHHEEALQFLRRAQSLQPDNGWTRSNLGSVLLRLQRVAEAIDEFENAVAILSAEPVPWFNLGNARFAGSDLDGAIEAYTRVIELRPGFPDAARRMAEAVEARARTAN